MLALHLGNRLLAVLLSLGLLAAVALTGTEAVRWLLGSEPWLVPWPSWAESVRTLTVGDPVVRAVSAGLAVLGLLLLVAELRPRRPAALDAEPLATDVDTVATRAGVRAAAVTAARSVAGVRSAKASVVRARVDVGVVTRARGETRAGLKEDVQRAVEGAVSDLGLKRPLRVRARVQEQG